MKKIVILPTLLTLGNAVCGFAAIVFASKIDPHAPATDTFFAVSGWLILAAMVFDALDGYAARLSKTASDFGGQLDSLCDAVSFGVAPAFVLLRLGQGWQSPVAQQVLAAIAVLYLSCTVLRLARFNVENSPDPAAHKRFKGLPSPGAAGCLATLAILRGGVERSVVPVGAINAWIATWAPVGALVVALLMVSRLSYPHATKQLLRRRRHFGYMLHTLVLLSLVALLREVALLVVFWGYALSIPVRVIVVRALRAAHLTGRTYDDTATRHA
jgi:CDP-diacylglycerol--serine O-phosphatidyltransferase